MKCRSAKLSQLFTSLFVLTFPDPFQSLCHGLRCQQRCQRVQCLTWGQMELFGHLARFPWQLHSGDISEQGQCLGMAGATST